MPYDAITIDSNMFIRAGIDLEAGLLAQLAQFKDGPTSVVLSEIVVREVLKHLQQNTKKGRDAAMSALTRVQQLGLVAEADRDKVNSVSESLIDSRVAVRTRMGAFLERVGVELVQASHASVDDLLGAYFSADAPFEPTGDKKSEFPDAIALLSLEKWAADNNKKILAVSEDKGWAGFANKSERIDVETDFANALETVQLHAEAAEAGVARLLAAIDNGEAPDAANEIERLLSISLAEWPFDADGHSSMYFEVDTTELRFNHLDLNPLDGQYDITVVRVGSDAIVARIGAAIHATAVAEFSLSTWDSVDREYVGMGGSTAESEVVFDGAFLLTLSGDLRGPLDEIVVEEVEVVEAVGSVDFDEIQFEYGDDDMDDFDALLREEADIDATPDAEARGQDMADNDGPL